MSCKQNQQSSQCCLQRKEIEPLAQYVFSAFIWSSEAESNTPMPRLYICLSGEEVEVNSCKRTTHQGVRDIDACFELQL